MLPVRHSTRHIVRWPLSTPYTSIVADVAALLSQKPLAGDSKLILDYTGCDRPLMDIFKQAGLRPIGVSIHGGDRVARDGMDFRVPKRDLVGSVAVLLQQHRLQIAEHLPLQPLLIHELLNFKVRIDPSTAHDSYSVWI